MIVTTTPDIEGKKIVKYLEIVGGETVMGANFVKDFFASVTDVIGGRSGAYEKELIRAKEIAIKEMKERAEKLGANAIVGVDIDYESLRQGTMLMVSVSGTAVIVDKEV